MKRSFTLSCILVLSHSAFASAAIITEFEFTGNTLVPTTVATNVTASDLTTFSTTSTTGSGLITDGPETPSGDPQFAETGFADGGYFSFTVQADSGYMLNLTDFEFYQRLGSTGAGRTYELEYIIDGGLPVSFASGDASTLTYTQRNGALAITGETLPIEFRINGLIDNNITTFRIDDVLLSGSVELVPPPVVPEPSSLMLLALGALGLLRRTWRRRRRA